MRSVLRGVGELGATAGVVVLLFAAYLVHGTGWAAARDQSTATAELGRRWSAPTVAADAVAGQPVMRLAVPRSGRVHTVLEGTDQDVLARGPGRYPGSAQPGERGNVALAGHRVTRGAPFEALDALEPCDPLLLETRDAWWVYRVLPGPGRRACGAPLPGPYADLAGLRVVAPGHRGVIAPVPDHPGADPEVALLTLTTCHPRYSARERLVVHAALDRVQPKADGPPPELRGIAGEGA